MSVVALILFALFIAVTLSVWLIMAGTNQAFAAYRERYTAVAEENLSKMFVFIDTRKMFVSNIAALLLVPLVVYFVFGNFFYAVVLGIGLFVLPKVLYRYMANRRLRDIESVLPDSLTQIAGSMRAGATLATAIEAMVQETKGPISQEFGLVLREQRLGVTMEEALEHLGQRIQSADINLIVTAALVARDVGGNLAEIFDRLASTLREKAAMEGKIRALTAQGKLQGIVVALLPFGMILVLDQMEPEAMAPMFHSLAGWLVLGVILIMELLGWFMIRKIVSIDV